MKIWNVSDNEIWQMYNSKPIIIKENSMVEFSDDVAVFLLSKREIRGQGLVQVKDGDNKEERYNQARLSIYNWNKEIYDNFERHCEEREAQRLQPLKPHEEIVKAKKIIDDYESWVEKGKPVREEIKETIGEKKIVYACPYCSKEFDVKVAYFGHLQSHQKEKVNVDIGSVSNKGKGEG